MKLLRNKALSFLLILSLFVGMVGVVNVDTTYAASKKIHIKKKTVTLYVSDKYQQKLIGKNGKKIKATKVKWKSKKKAVAVINKKGKITALKPGTAKMTAKYKGKTYKFKVVVKAAPVQATPKIQKQVQLPPAQTSQSPSEQLTTKIATQGYINGNGDPTYHRQVDGKGDVYYVDHGTYLELICIIDDSQNNTKGLTTLLLDKDAPIVTNGKVLMASPFGFDVTSTIIVSSYTKTTNLRFYDENNNYPADVYQKVLNSFFRLGMAYWNYSLFLDLGIDLTDLGFVNYK